LTSFSLSDDQVVIFVSSALAIVLALFAFRLWKRKQRLAALPLISIAVFLLMVVWFFATFQMRLM